ncbi:MAG: hypothetical protein K6G55_05680 [Selenomonadaceae bacterium]|nr:hypothetical protein [Selenomonadaceae bacterium]
MKKFFAALMFVFIFAANNFVCAEPTEKFSDTQYESIVAYTENNPLFADKNAATLPIDFAAFQNNFNTFIKNFLADSNVGDNLGAAQEFLLLNNPQITKQGGNDIFTKGYINQIAIVGVSTADSNIKLLNIFFLPEKSKEDAVVKSLIVHAFVKGVAPDCDTEKLFDAINEDMNKPVIVGNVKFSAGAIGDINVLTASVAN